MPHPNCVCVSLNNVAFVLSNARGVGERSYLKHPSDASSALFPSALKYARFVTSKTDRVLESTKSVYDFARTMLPLA
jgi:hypothetical protein